MTIGEAISTLDNLKPNTASRPDKVKWLSRLDGQIKAEIIDTHVQPATTETDTVVDPHYRDDTPETTELLAPYPYDELYIKYMTAMIDYANGEIGRYNNSMLMFNAAYRDFANWYNRTYMPVGKDMRCY